MKRVMKILTSFLLVSVMSGCLSSKATHQNRTADPASPAQPKETAGGFHNALNIVDEYLHDIEEDQKNWDGHVDIVVGDKLYMTQINDWFINFSDYEDKVVEIEGFFLEFDQYYFIGRNGPTCPYCTGGFVDFEFQTNADTSQLRHAYSWIRVTGYLRHGNMKAPNNSQSRPFYYIEAMELEVLPEQGITTITD